MSDVAAAPRKPRGNRTAGLSRKGRSSYLPIKHAVERTLYALDAICRAVETGNRSLALPHLRDAKQFMAAARGDLARCAAGDDIKPEPAA